MLSVKTPIQINNDFNVPNNRLPYNSRQRQPSTDSDTSDTISDVNPMEGPGANEYKFTELTHPNQVNVSCFKCNRVHRVLD